MISSLEYFDDKQAMVTPLIVYIHKPTALSQVIRVATVIWAILYYLSWHSQEN